ncbi:V-type proton ATPase subunit F [Rhodotorula toruloides]|nr:V-type proton ATPase subunit F [Rhodotorula toruloides]
MSNATQYRDRSLIATIGDEDTITGLLLAGTGHIDGRGKKNFLVVDSKTPVSTIESAFAEFTERSDIAILLINQHVRLRPAPSTPRSALPDLRVLQVAEMIRPTIEKYQQAFPALLEIPAKDHPYDPSKDSVLKAVKKHLGE